MIKIQENSSIDSNIETLKLESQKNKTRFSSLEN